jgi:hypothetical protein
VKNFNVLKNENIEYKLREFSKEVKEVFELVMVVKGHYKIHKLHDTMY